VGFTRTKPAISGEGRKINVESFLRSSCLGGDRWQKNQSQKMETAGLLTEVSGSTRNFKEGGTTVAGGLERRDEEKVARRRALM